MIAYCAKRPPFEKYQPAFFYINGFRPEIHHDSRVEEKPFQVAYKLIDVLRSFSMFHRRRLRRRRLVIEHCLLTDIHGACHTGKEFSNRLSFDPQL